MNKSPDVQFVSTTIGGVASTSANEDAVLVGLPAIACGRDPMLEQRAEVVRGARRIADRAEAQAALASIRVAEASTRLNVIVTELAQIQYALRGASRL